MEKSIKKVREVFWNKNCLFYSNDSERYMLFHCLFIPYFQLIKLIIATVLFILMV